MRVADTEALELGVKEAEGDEERELVPQRLYTADVASGEVVGDLV